MSNQNIVDHGLFNFDSIYSGRFVKSTNTYESIQNLFKTIKEYRDYANPNDENSWKGYIIDFFQLLGFTMHQSYERIYTLKSIGSDSISSILIGLSLPQENSIKICNWLDWSYLLKIDADSRNLRWGIWTNGMEIKIFDLTRDDYTDVYCWMNIENIISDGLEDGFYQVHNIFSKLHFFLLTLKTNNENYRSEGKTNKNTSYYRQSTSIRQDTHSRSNPKNNQPIHTPPVNIPTPLIWFHNVYTAMKKNGNDFELACEEVAQTNNVTFNTVRHNCTTRIHTKASEVSSLINDKERLIKILNFHFPSCEDEIDDLFT